MPPKNPPIPPILQERCRMYLRETSHSKWSFNDFWEGDENMLSAFGLVWLKELQVIISSTTDHRMCVAAVAARNKYKERDHIPEASRGRKGKGSRKGRKRGARSNPPEPPPAYEQCPREDVAESAPHVQFKSLCEERHKALSPGRKWHLPGGRTVEDTLFSSVMKQFDVAGQLGQAPRETYAHSYILDIGDPAICALFTPEEWDAVLSLLLPPPVIDDHLMSFMHKFVHVKTSDDLRHLLATTHYLPPGETYSRDKHSDQAWVYSVLASLIVLYEHEHLPCATNLEAWYQINIWGPIFDRCFQGHPKTSISRSEVQSPLNSSRKHLSIFSRKPIGSRYDGIITHSGTEYGAVEDSKGFTGEKSKKWTSDSLKLVKLLHDQLRALEALVRHDSKALVGFRCVGFLTAGLHCQGLFLQYGRGYVCLLKPSGRCAVPEDIASMVSLLEVLATVWRMREALKESVNNLARYLGDSEVLFREVMEKEERAASILATCFDTDLEG